MEDGEALQQRVLEMMRHSGYQPRTKGELAKDLDLRTDEKGVLREVLGRLEREKLIIFGNKGRYKLPKVEKGLLTGNLRMQGRGSAWFFPDHRNEANLSSGFDLEQLRRVFIPARGLSVALDGDQVLVRLESTGAASGGKAKKVKKGGKRQWTELPPGMEGVAVGRVEEIVQRRSGVVVGTFMKQGKFCYVVPDDENLPPSIELLGETTANSGQKVSVTIEEWKHRDAIPQGRVVRVLGYPGEPGVDMLAIIEAHGLRTEFPDEVVAEAKSVPEQIPADELARREDWRQKFVFTIDPVNAKDFDDAIAVREVDGGWELAVHIADVAHYVKPDQPLDREAEKRGNSTYLVDRVLPMLPPELSNGICSLRPREDRLTCAAIMRFDAKGRMGKARFVKAVINSKHRLTYEEAQEFIETGMAGKPKEMQELGAAIAMAWELASLLRRRRFAHGALDLEMAEISLILDEKGKAVGYRREEYNESHQLIEDCMLAANEAVARAIKNAQRPGIYRIHEDPDFDKLAEFTELARTHGYDPGDLTNRKHIQKLLDAAKGRPEEHAIKLGLLKSLKRAAYATEPVGHYGLAKTDYCHFTSPIRRYADLIVHRSLEPLLVNPPKKTDRLPSKAHCEEIAEHISATERASASAEMESKRLKLLQWLKESADSDDPPVFHAVVTDVRNIGLMVEATEIMQRGMVKREAFPEGDWRFEAHRMRFTSRKGELALNDVVPVVVDAVNIERQFVDYRMVVEGEETKREGKRAGGKAASGGDKKVPAKKAAGEKRSFEGRPKSTGGRKRSPGDRGGRGRSKGRG